MLCSPEAVCQCGSYGGPQLCAPGEVGYMCEGGEGEEEEETRCVRCIW